MLTCPIPGTCPNRLHDYLLELKYLEKNHYEWRRSAF